MVFLRSENSGLARHFGVRAREVKGRRWITTQEQPGGPAGSIPYLLDVPTDVAGDGVPEIVLLKPIEAQFTVRTPTAATP